jgi:hypothetical protein
MKAQVAVTALLSLPFAQAQTGADDWRLSPQRLLTAGPDGVPRDISAKRDKHFDDVYSPPPKGWVTSGTDYVEAPGEIWTNSGMKTICTEITLKAQQVLRDPSATVQPEKTLTVLLPGGFEWGKSWDLTTGVAVPTYPLDIKLEAAGKSRFAGMPEDNLLAAVKAILSSGTE